MAPPTVAILHGGPGVEVALLEYLSRVLLHLLAFGGVAALVFWGPDAVDAVRSAFVADPDGEASER